jgi:hypothetical protein
LSLVLIVPTAPRPFMPRSQLARALQGFPASPLLTEFLTDAP